VQHLGTFTPIWHLIRDLCDKISLAHVETVTAYQDLQRNIHSYQEVFQRKVKIHIQKDSDISRTTDLIAHLNHAWIVVSKAKEQYHTYASDYERAKHVASSFSYDASGSQENNSGNTLTTKQIERLEKKTRLLHDDYKLAMDKYNAVRYDYEKCFSEGHQQRSSTTSNDCMSLLSLFFILFVLVCTKFQDFEIDHIEKMLAFSLTYSDIVQRNNEQMQSAQNEFSQKLKSLTGSYLLDAFVEQKKTGLDRPGIDYLPLMARCCFDVDYYR
jgi:F-BAR domain only protein